MNCHDARQGVSALGMGLTERALVHAHALQCVECRKERESLPQVVSSRQRVEPSRAAWLIRPRVLLSISLTRFGQAAVRVFEGARVGVTRVLDLLTRVRGLRSVLVKLSERAVANVIGTTRFSLTVFGQAAERVAEVARAGVARVTDLLTRARWLPPVLFARSERVAVKAMGATGAVGRVVVTSSRRARPLLKVCTGIVSLAILIAAVLASWPRQWPDNLMPRLMPRLMPSPGERLSRDVRLPVDRKPAELAVAAPLVKTSTPKSVPAPQPAMQTEIPASLRAARNAEASDSTAAIDWLLEGGSSRRGIENPSER